MNRIKNFEEWITSRINENVNDAKLCIIPEKYENNVIIDFNAEKNPDFKNEISTISEYIKSPIVSVYLEDLASWEIDNGLDEYETAKIPMEVIHVNEDDHKLWHTTKPFDLVRFGHPEMEDGMYLFINEKDIFTLSYFLSFRKKWNKIPWVKSSPEFINNMKDVNWIRKNVPAEMIEKIPIDSSIKGKLKSFIIKNKFDL